MDTAFFNDTHNKRFLYYGHIDRGDNHYQYYIRTEEYLKKIDEDDNFTKWTSMVGEKIRSFTEGKNAINILMAPSHFSNEAFIASINDKVFLGKAQIINFDVRKEFRSNVDAKYSNYKELQAMLGAMVPKEQPVINFYYVDDQINTGTTFSRAKSLASSLMSDFYKGNVNIFKGIILLTNRCSDETKRGYVDTVEINNEQICPFFSYLSLSIPSLRSFGDACPLCKNNSKAISLLEESKLNSMDYYWREKVFYHRVINLDMAKKIDEKLNGLREITQERGFRRLQCEQAIWNFISESKDDDVLKNNFSKMISENIRTCKKIENKIEKLISFIKVMARPVIIYQERMKTVVHKFLLSLFECITYDSDYNELKTLCRVKNIKSNSKLILDLYKIVVARLCDNNSNFLLAQKDGHLILFDAYKKSIELIDGDTDCVFKLGIFFIASLKNMLSKSAEDVRTNFLKEVYKGINFSSIEDSNLSNFYLALYLELYNYKQDGSLRNKIQKWETTPEDSRLEFINNYDREAVLPFTVDNINGSKLVSLVSAGKDLQDVQLEKNIEKYCNQNYGYYIEEKENGSKYMWLLIGNNYNKIREEFELYDDYTKSDLKKQEIRPLYLRIFLCSYGQLDMSCLNAVMNILSVRNDILELAYGNLRNDAYERRLENERMAQALSIAKAMSHSAGKEQTKMDYGELLKTEQTELATALLIRKCNDWISRIYQLVVTKPHCNYCNDVSVASWTDRMKEIFSKEDNGGICKFTLHDKSYLRDIIINISIDKNVFDKEMYIRSDMDGEFCEYLAIIVLLALNAGKAVKDVSSDNETCDVYVSIMGQYLVIKNKSLSMKIDKDMENAKQKIEIEPWLFKKEEQSITLWALNKYTESICEAINVLGPCMVVCKEEDADNNEYFVLKLKLIRKMYKTMDISRIIKRGKSINERMKNGKNTNI